MATSSLTERSLPFRLLNSDDVADMLGVDSRTVRRMALAGRFPRVELGHRTIRFRLADVLEFIEANAAKNEEGRPADNGTASETSGAGVAGHGSG
jgi:excisionase family DNA binding protein